MNGEKYRRDLCKAEREALEEGKSSYEFKGETFQISPRRVEVAQGEGLVFIARCPKHGLHGGRERCFECGAEVEQVPMVPLSTKRKAVMYTDSDHAWRLYLIMKDDLNWESRAKSWAELPEEAKGKLLAYVAALDEADTSRMLDA